MCLSFVENFNKSDNYIARCLTVDVFENQKCRVIFTSVLKSKPLQFFEKRGRRYSVRFALNNMRSAFSKYIILLIPTWFLLQRESTTIIKSQHNLSNLIHNVCVLCEIIWNFSQNSNLIVKFQRHFICLSFPRHIVFYVYTQYLLVFNILNKFSGYSEMKWADFSSFCLVLITKHLVWSGCRSIMLIGRRYLLNVSFLICIINVFINTKTEDAKQSYTTNN